MSEVKHCCTSGKPCGLAQGDCDRDSECKGDLVCGKNNCGSAFSWRFADCCEDPAGK